MKSVRQGSCSGSGSTASASARLKPALPRGSQTTMRSRFIGWRRANSTTDSCSVSLGVSEPSRST